MSRHDPTGLERRAIQPHLPDRMRGVPRVNDRRVPNGIFRVLRSGARCADLPARHGPPTTICNRLNRWREAGRGTVSWTRSRKPMMTRSR